MIGLVDYMADYREDQAMVAVTLPEISPGLNTYLDPAILRNCKGVLTNAGKGRVPNRPGPFLVIEIYPKEGNCLCVPLYSHDGKGRIEIDASLKTGPGSGWVGRKSFFQTLQFWVIPMGCIPQASQAEMNPIGKRKRYADNAPGALADIAAHKDDSNFPYLPI